VKLGRSKGARRRFPELPTPTYLNIQELREEVAAADSAPEEPGSSVLDWETHTDTDSGHLFYYNPVTGETTWDCPFGQAEDGVSPVASPASSLAHSPEFPEWEQYMDEASGQAFFYNSVTGETSWDPPNTGHRGSSGDMYPGVTRYSPMEQRVSTQRGTGLCLGGPFWQTGIERGWMEGERGQSTPKPRAWGEQVSLLLFPVKTPRDCPLLGDSHPDSFPQVTLLLHGALTKRDPKAEDSWGPQGPTVPKLVARTPTPQRQDHVLVLQRDPGAMGGRCPTGDIGHSCLPEGGKPANPLQSRAPMSPSPPAGCQRCHPVPLLPQRHPSTLTTPEHTVELRGATLAWAGKDKSSKKHVLELKTREGSEFLIQHDSEQIIAAWQKAIADSIGRLGTDLPGEEDAESGAEFGSREKLGGSEEKRAAAGQAMGSASESDSSKVRNKLRKFLQRRPTLQSLRERGYIKDQVFGCSLQALCERERGTVPRFVLQCIQTVERRGLDIDGLYRVSGNLATVQKLRYKVEHDEHLDLDDGRWEDIHVVTGALKLFFRELPEPLVPFSHFDKFIAAIKMQDPTRRGRCIRDLVFSLPPAHHDTMKVLFRHLCRVIEYKEENRMSVQSIAIVFGPTLLRPASEEGNMAMHMVFQNQVVEHILNQYSYIFPDG
uniref:Rho GTPase activating protein 27 n=1 Tax=Athene cunicularia TaxID=194338 RepID=A0A663MWP8_ATHCN